MKQLQTFTVALVQMKSFLWSPDKNIVRMEAFIKKAAIKGADVIIFPEDVVTGQMLRNQKMVDREGRFLNIFRAFAKHYRIDIVPGSWMEGKKGERSCYNTSYYIDCNGKVLARYRKIHLWIPERAYIKPGNEIVTFNTRFGKAGIVICWDLTSPDLFQTMVRKGVEIVYCPSDWPKNMGIYAEKYGDDIEAHHVNALCMARAFENNIILVYANTAEFVITEACGYKGEALDEPLGYSQIAAPFGDALIRIKHPREAMVLQKIDLNILKDAKAMYKLGYAS